MKTTLRKSFLLAFIICTSVICAALYLQWSESLDPCPLCIIQRVAFIGIAGVFIIGAIGPVRRWFYYLINSSALLLCIFGAVIAGRQLWLQSLPAGSAPGCGPGLNYMLKYLPIGDMMHLIFYGSGECAEIDWSILGISLAGWALAAFILFAIFCIWNYRSIAKLK